MRITLDENLPVRLVHILVPLGHETDTVPQEGLAGQDDARIWQAAQVETMACWADHEASPVYFPRRLRMDAWSLKIKF